MSLLIIGGGKMGLSHLAILSRLLKRTDVALCESSRLMRFIFSRFKYRTFASLQEALSCGLTWSGAIVATPTTSHFYITKALLERGIPCFVEKPLTLNVEHSRELLALSKKQSAYVQMGLVARFIAAFVRTRQIIRSGVLGQPINYQARMLGNVITRADNNGWRTVFSKGGGCLNEYGPHLIDLCRYFFGEVREVGNVIAGQTFSKEADDHINAHWVHDSGCAGHITLDWCDSTKRKATLAFDIEFEVGILKVTNTDIVFEGRPGAQLNAEARQLIDTQLVPHSVNYYLRGEEYSLQLEVFIGTILEKRLLLLDELPDDTAAKLEDGLAVDHLIQEIAKKAGLL